MPNCQRAVFLAVLALTLASRPASAQALDAQALDSLIAKTVIEHHLVGVSVGVVVNGQVVLSKGYGVRSLTTGQPVTTETMFRIGSVSKQFTCAATLLLQEGRKLSLTDPVARYFPGLTRARDITLADLGGHLSGYHDYYPLDYVDRRMEATRAPDQIIAEYGTMPLDFEPRSRYSYSNTGFLILGRVIEKASGVPYEEFLQRRVLGPLQLTHTRFEPGSGEAELGAGYTAFSLGEPRPAVPEGKGWLGAAGGLWSTPGDLLAWDLALMDGKVLSRPSWFAMSTPLRLTDGRSSGYGCGLGIRDRGPALVLSHGGAVSGFTAWNMMIPASRTAAVVLANMDFAATGTITDAIMRALLPAPAIPDVPSATAADAARALIEQFRRGEVDPATLSGEFATYLTPARLADARAAIEALGPTGQIDLLDQWERGGLAVASLRIQLGQTAVQALLYRRTDGTVEEFLPYWP